MKPSLPSIPTPTKCGDLRHKYADVGQSQTFITAIQTKIDGLAAYVSNSLANDLSLIKEASDVGVFFKNLVRYIRIEKKAGNTTPEYLNFNQLTVFDENSNNISLNKAARSSSVYNISSPPGNAVNGRSSSSTNMFASNIEASPWWEVDLASTARVSKVAFYNRVDCCQSRANLFQLLVLNQNRETIKSFPLNSNQIQEFVITSPSNQEEVVNEKVNSLREVESELQAAMGCLDKEINQRQGISSDIYSLQGQVKDKEKVVETKHTNVQAARERAHLLRDPNSETTVWESWFPLGRPLEKHSVPVLWFFAIVFLVVSIGLFLQLAGFSLDIGGKVQSLSTVVAGTTTGVKNAVEKAKGAFMGPPKAGVNLSGLDLKPKAV